MTPLKLPRLLLIAGTGRNSGKTTLACRIITKYSNTQSIVAMKISPHRHNIEPGGQIWIQNDHICILEETDWGTGKDSSRMLAAGAKRSFFISATEDNLASAVQETLKLVSEDAFMICESGGLRKWVEPGLFLMVSRNGPSVLNSGKRDLIDFEPVWVHFDGQKFDFDLDRIVIQQNSWKTKSLYDTV
jgi:hypothetical protein